MGVPIPAVDSSLTGTARFDAEYQALGQAWVSQDSAMLGDEALKTWYDQGPSKSGVACVQHILVAESRKRRLCSTGSTPAKRSAMWPPRRRSTRSRVRRAARLGCQPLSNFTQSFVPEFVDGSLAAEVGVPTQPVESQFGQHVIRITPFDELSSDDVILARLIALGQWHDVETDPEIGAWGGSTSRRSGEPLE